MNFNENDLWRNKTKLPNLRFSKLHSAKVLLKLEFDTKDQVLFNSSFGYSLIVTIKTKQAGDDLCQKIVFVVSNSKSSKNLNTTNK